MARVMKLTDGTFGDVVFHSQTAVLVEFWSPSTQNQRSDRSALLEAVAVECGDRIRVMRLDVDENPVAPMVYGVAQLPRAVLFRQGEEIGRWGSSLRKEEVLARLELA